MANILQNKGDSSRIAGGAEHTHKFQDPFRSWEKQ